MSQTEEQESERRTLDFSSCIKCQQVKFLPVTRDSCKRRPTVEPLRKSTVETYQHFLDQVNLRSHYGNPEFISLQQSLHGLTAVDLERDAVWHRSCYSEVTHKQHTDRDRKYYESLQEGKNRSEVYLIRGKKGRPSTKQLSSCAADVLGASAASQSPLRRSNVKAFNRDLCFYCQNEAGNDYDLHSCRSLDMGNSMKAVVNSSDNEMWKLYLSDVLAEGDFHARDIKYHKSCHTSNWRKYVQWPNEKAKSIKISEQSVKFISAEIEFFGRLQERINDGAIIPLQELVSSYDNIMEMYGICCDGISRFKLEAKLQDNITNFVITSGTKKFPTVIHSKKAGCEAVKQVHEHDTRKEMKNLYQAAMTLRRGILKKRKDNPWKFEGSLCNAGEKGVPDELVTTIKWILQGASDVDGHAKLQEVHTKCQVISQSISQACRSERQVKYVSKSCNQSDLRFIDRNESPIAVGVSLYMYHQFRSQKAVLMLNRCGIGIHPKRVAAIKNYFMAIAMENVRENGVYVPSGLVKGQFLRASLDNIDMKVDTPDGKGTFHGTAMAVYQRSVPRSHEVDPVSQTRQSGKIGESKWQESVPPTVIQLCDCPIEGNPKPKTSPKYKSFKPWRYEDCLQSNMSTNIWLLARHFNRMVSNDDDDADASNKPGMSRGKQSVPIWAAYNSLLQDSSNDHLTDVDKVFGMPLINAPANEWKTLITALGQLEKLNSLVHGASRKLVVNMDMDLYKRAMKLQYLHPQFQDKWHLFPGPFHIVICALRCLGRTVEGSGLEEAWREAELYGNVVISQIIHGSHYNRAMSAHIITLQTLYDLYIHAFLDATPRVKDALQSSADMLVEACSEGGNIHDAHKEFLMNVKSLNLEKQLKEYDSKHNSAMQKWVRQYMRQVLNMLLFQQAVREGNWTLFLAALEKMCIYFFAYNRLDYAQNIPEFLARMQDIEVSDPAVWDEFNKGNFTVNTHNNTPFTRLGIDQAQEHLNKGTKGEGGITGIASNPTLLLKFCLTAPQLARISKETEHLLTGREDTSDGSKHHNLSRSKVIREEEAISKLKNVLGPCNIFGECRDENKNQMFKLVSKEVIPDDVAKSILSLEDVGKETYEKYVEDRLKGDVNMWSKMSKTKVKTWNTTAKTVKMKSGTDVITLKASATLFARLLVIARSGREDIDLQEAIGKHEFASTNKRLMKSDGNLHPTTDKSQVVHMLCDESGVSADDNPLTSQDQKQQAKRQCLLVDGMVVVQEVMAVGTFQTCKDLAMMYVRHIDSKAKEYDHVRVVFDNYSKLNSLKENTRQRRKGNLKSMRSYIVDDNTIIRDKREFLSSNETKDSLTLYLSKYLLTYSTVDCLVVVNRKDVICNRQFPVTTPVSTQEEADTLLILHALELATSGFAINIYSHDTDVFLLALRRVAELGGDVSVITGTGKRRKKINLKPIYDWIGEPKAKALINWHALTGCDTTGHLLGKSKRTCFKAFMCASPEVIEAISRLGICEEPSTVTFNYCEEFLCQLFCPKNVNITKPEQLRWYFFKRITADKGVDNLPPTSGAWYEHLKRARCQAIIWQQDLEVNPTVPDPLQFGWSRYSDRFVPVLSSVPPAPDSVSQFLRCKCGEGKNGEKAVCMKRCSCRKHDLVCTELCSCGGDYDVCLNMQVTVEEDAEDSNSESSEDDD